MTMKNNTSELPTRAMKIEKELNESSGLIHDYLETIEKSYDDIITDVAVCRVAMDRLEQIYKNGELSYLLEIIDNMRGRLKKMEIEMVLIQKNPDKGL